jgi:hypothetical protein
MGCLFRLLQPAVGEMEGALAGHLATDLLITLPPNLLAPYTSQVRVWVLVRVKWGSRDPHFTCVWMRGVSLFRETVRFDERLAAHVARALYFFILPVYLVACRLLS